MSTVTHPKTSSWRTRLHLGSHHTIERFGVLFATLVVSLAFIASGALMSANGKYAHQLGSTAAYTHKFTTSKTKINGTVAGVFTDPTHKRAMLLLHFDDVTKVSTDASTYQSFLTGSSLDMKQEQLKTKPSGAIYIFGTTGYMGVYLVNVSGFPSQVLNLTMRANAELVPATSVSLSKALSNDASFALYDQWRIYFNPGASGVTVSQALAADTPDMRELYNEMVVQPQEQKARAALDADLLLMKADLTKIGDYTNRLVTTKIPGSNLHVMAPQTPSIIAGDQVTGTAGTDGKASSLTLVTSKIVGGGYNFDWRNGSVEKGYLDGLVPRGMDYVTYLTNQANAASSTMSVAKLVFVMSDGTLLSDYSNDVSTVADMNNNATLLLTAYQAYFRDKVTYQTTDLSQLLSLEVALRDVGVNHSVNTAKNAVLVY